jgi:hypothetical protein
LLPLVLQAAPEGDDAVAALQGEREQRDKNAEGPNPADQGMLPWGGFNADPKRGGVSQVRQHVL